MLRITDSEGLRPKVQAQNNVVIYDFPPLGGTDTDKELILPSSILWKALATRCKNLRLRKKSLS